MIEKKWSKSSEKLLDEIFEGKGEITLLEREQTVEELMEDLFGRFCGLSDGLIKNGQIDSRSILLTILKDPKERFKVEEEDITDIGSEEVKNKLKDKDMWGYIISVYVKKLNQNNIFVGNSLMRTLYAPKIFFKSIIDIDSSLKPVIFKERLSGFDSFDLWALRENPENNINERRKND